MGRLVAGEWVAKEPEHGSGGFVREPNRFAGPVPLEISRALREEPSRFLLVASASCPWSHAVLCVRALKGLSIPVHLASGRSDQGYALAHGEEWLVPGSTTSVHHLHELYTLCEASLTGRATVPVLWDTQEQCILSNDSMELMRALDRAPALTGEQEWTLFPRALGPRFGKVLRQLDTGLFHGIYESVMARYEMLRRAAHGTVTRSLHLLERTLSQRRYLLGDVITAADLRLFTFLVRFDAVYAPGHHLPVRLSQFDALSLWLADVLEWRGLAGALNEQHMLRGAAEAPEMLSPPAPRMSLSQMLGKSHGRERLGAAGLMTKSGERIYVDPATTLPVSSGHQLPDRGFIPQAGERAPRPA